MLHRSGIGPADWLAPLGIDVTLDRQGVGRNLQDHLQQRAIYKVEGVRTLNETYYSLLRRGLMGLDYAFRRRGPLTMAPSQLGIFTRSDSRRERANIQFHVQPLSLDKFGDPLHRFPAITVSACNLQPTSRGTVRVRSAAADQAPAIAPNYLSTDDDRTVAADAIRTTRRLMKQQALAKYHPQEYLPGPSGRRRRCLTGKSRRRYRHHDLPSRRHRQDGSQRPTPPPSSTSACASTASRACASPMHP